jgi:hypothetical protein
MFIILIVAGIAAGIGGLILIFFGIIEYSNSDPGVGTVCLIIGLGLCGFCAYQFVPLTVKLETLEINGPWAEYLEVEEGRYKFKIAGTWKTAVLSVPVSFRLKKTWEGESSNPAETLSLQPLTGDGAALPGESFLVADTDRFNDFVRRAPGARMTVSFRRDAALPALSKGQARRLVKSIKSFEGWSLERAAGKFVVAVAPVSTNGDIRTSAAMLRMSIISGLRENVLASRFTFVDTSQIDRIMEQHEFEVSDWSSGEKVAEIGKALNAAILVVAEVTAGTMFNLNTEYTISLLDINSMEVLGVAVGSVRNLSDITGVAKDIRISLPAGR